MNAHEQLYAHLPPAVAQACYDVIKLDKVWRTPEEQTHMRAADDLLRLHRAYSFKTMGHHYAIDHTLREWWRAHVLVRVTPYALTTELQHECWEQAQDAVVEHPLWAATPAWDPWENDDIAKLALGELDALMRSRKDEHIPNYRERESIAKHVLHDRIAKRMPEHAEMFLANPDMRGLCRDHLLLECFQNALDGAMGEEDAQVLVDYIKKKQAVTQPDWPPNPDTVKSAILRVMKAST